MASSQITFERDKAVNTAGLTDGVGTRRSASRFPSTHLAAEDVDLAVRRDHAVAERPREVHGRQVRDGRRLRILGDRDEVRVGGRLIVLRHRQAMRR